MVQPHHNRLIHGDALDVLASAQAGSLDFVYCDPPFFTGRKQARPTRKSGRARAALAQSFDDRWDSMGAYLAWLEPRIAAMREALAPHGVFALHLDWHAGHYAKVMCDRLFGYENFVNEIVWAFRTGGTGKRWLARKHDNILVYGRTDRWAFYPQQEKRYLSHKYGFSNITLHEDDGGVFRWANMRDVWEIPALRGNQPENTGYPTQKPLTLLARLLECFTKPGDVAGDLCCGSGTLAVAAQNLGRGFVCADISLAALDVTQRRLGKGAPKIERIR